MVTVRGFLLIVIGIALAAGVWFLTARLPVDSPANVPVTPAANRDTTAENLPDPFATAQGAGAPPDVVPIWEEWPEPQLALLLTGEQHGYFEPCGCTANQMGGMARRADLLRKLTDAGWEVRGVDLGGLVRRSVRQAQIKFETTVQALRDLNYAAVGLGPEDLRLQPDFLLTQDIGGDDDGTLKFVSANLVFYDAPELGMPVPSQIVEAGGRRLGITCVMSESTRDDVIPEGANTGITWSEPEQALEKVLQTFDSQQVDFRILLSHSLPDESRALAEEFPQFDVVVIAQGFSDPDTKAAPEAIAGTLLLQVGQKGKYAGVLGIYPEDSQTPVRFQLIPLERSEFADGEEMIVHMRDYQQRLKDEQVVLADGVASYPSGASFEGADKCGECHSKAYEIWKDTPHAHAFESLDPEHKRNGYERLNGVPRMHDPECLSCHVTGWNPQEYIRYRSGFLNDDCAETEAERCLQALLSGNQCENCHGPGSRHVELIETDGDLELARQEVKVSLEQSKAICYRCHDVDNSPNFDFDDYWPDVEHYGLD